jgi:hypothetical protein
MSSLVRVEISSRRRGLVYIDAGCEESFHVLNPTFIIYSTPLYLYPEYPNAKCPPALPLVYCYTDLSFIYTARCSFQLHISRNSNTIPWPPCLLSFCSRWHPCHITLGSRPPSPFFAASLRVTRQCSIHKPIADSIWTSGCGVRRFVDWHRGRRRPTTHTCI